MVWYAEFLNVNNFIYLQQLIPLFLKTEFPEAFTACHVKMTIHTQSNLEKSFLEWISDYYLLSHT